MTIVIIIAAALILLIALACCKVSGDCSRQEEVERAEDGK